MLYMIKSSLHVFRKLTQQGDESEIFLGKYEIIKNLNKIENLHKNYFHPVLCSLLLRAIYSN